MKVLFLILYLLPICFATNTNPNNNLYVCCGLSKTPLLRHCIEDADITEIKPICSNLNGTYIENSTCEKSCPPYMTSTITWTPTPSERSVPHILRDSVMGLNHLFSLYILILFN
jgi:hypothetical protein